MDRERISQLEELRRARVQEAKRMIQEAGRSGRALTDAERDRLDELLSKQEVINAELQQAFYAPPADDA